MKESINIAVSIALVMSLRSGVSRAEENTTEAAHIAEMKAIYDKGVALYDQEKYGEAAAAFRELVKGLPKFQYYFNIGECEYMRKRFDLAKEAFDVFLEEVGDKADPGRRAHAEEVVEEVTPILGYLNVDETDRLEVWVDGEHRSVTPMQKPVVLMSGEHTVVLKENGEPVFETQIIVKHGETVMVKRVALQPETAPQQPSSEETAPEPEAAPEEMTADPEPESKTSALKVAGVAMIGVGGALLVAGAVTGGLAVSKSAQLADKCPDKDRCNESYKNLKTDGEALKASTIGLVTVGAVFATAGTIMAVVEQKKKTSKTRETVVASPLILGTTVGLTINGSF